MQNLTGKHEQEAESHSVTGKQDIKQNMPATHPKEANVTVNRPSTCSSGPNTTKKTPKRKNAKKKKKKRYVN